MIRPKQGLSMDRQDDLLLRLKNYVGQISTKPKQSSYSAIKKHKKVEDEQYYNQNVDKSYQTSHKRNDRSPVNLTNSNKNSHSKYSDRKESNLYQEQQNIPLRTKKYLQPQENQIKSYWTDRKALVPFNQSTNFINLRNNFSKNQIEQQKLLTRSHKNVTQSTKKRILQRASLIDETAQEITLINSSQNQLSNQKKFLERLSQKKIQYGFQQVSQNSNERLNSYRQSLTKRDYGNSLQKERQRPKITAEKQNLSKCKQDSFQKINSQKYDNYSKFSMENLVKENDLRKAEKIQKLQKITQINENINNRIKKLVDNFQNYLTRRVVS